MVSESKRKRQREAKKKTRARKRAEEERSGSFNNQQHGPEKTLNDAASPPLGVLNGTSRPSATNSSDPSFPVHPVPLAQKLKPFNTAKAADALIKYYRQSKEDPLVPNETICPGYVFMSITIANKNRTQAELKQIKGEMLSIIAARDPELEEELERYIAAHDVVQNTAPKDGTKAKDNTSSSEKCSAKNSDGNNMSKTTQDDSTPQKLTSEPEKRLTRIEQALLTIKTTTPAMQELQRKLEAKRDGVQDITLKAQSHDEDETSSGSSSEDDNTIEGKTGKFHKGKPKAENKDKNGASSSRNTSEEEGEGESFESEPSSKKAVGTPVTGSKKSDGGSGTERTPYRKHALESREQKGSIKRQRIDTNDRDHIENANDIPILPQKTDARAVNSPSSAESETSSVSNSDDDTSSEGTVATPDATPTASHHTPTESTVASKKQAFAYTNDIATYYDKEGNVSFLQKIAARQATTRNDDEADTAEAAGILGIPNWFPLKIKDILISLSWGSEEDSLPWKVIIAILFTLKPQLLFS
jgi:hypothetical protein